MQLHRAVVSLLLVVVAPTLIAADEPTKVDTSLRQISIFRNGMAVAIREGQLPDRSGPIEITPLPVAAQGTFWLAWGEGVGLGEVMSRPVPVIETRMARSAAELLAANTGREVILHLHGERGESIAGTLVSAPTPAARPVVSPHLVQPLDPGERRLELVLVRTTEPEASVIGVPPEWVARVTVEGEPQLTVVEERSRLGLFADLQATSDGARVSVNYLTRGISWTPGYLVDISGDGTAKIAARALVRNDIEDLEGVELFVVSGYPHLPLVTSPSMLTQYSELLGSLAQQTWRRTGYAAPAGQRAAAAAYEARRGARTEYLQTDVYDLAPDYGPAAEVAKAEDLHYYPLGRVTLPLAATGYFPMFTAEAPYEHIYRWDIPDYIEASGHYRPPTETTEPQEIVWHCLRLTNNMNYAWMVAPAEAVRDGRVIGQDILPYTAPGATSLLKIAQAREIEAEEAELETAREARATTFRGRHYDRVTVQGRLNLRSHRSSPTPLEIVKNFSGELLEASPEARSERMAAGLRAVNPRSRLTWELTLPPGESLEIAYSFTVYVTS